MFDYLWIFLPIYYVVKLIIWIFVDKGTEDYRTTKEKIIEWWKYIVITLISLFLCGFVVKTIGDKLASGVSSGSISEWNIDTKFYVYIILAQIPIIVITCVINQYIRRRSLNKAFGRYLDEQEEKHKTEREKENEVEFENNEKE